MTPPIARVEAPTPGRLGVVPGGAAGSKLLQVVAPELLPGEDREVWVYFETPALFRSVDEWRRAYGYPDDVFVYRLTVSKQELVKSFK